MDQRPSWLPLVTGILLIASGWAVIYLGWQRAAAQKLEVGQLPYIVSGGFGGLGLLLLGAAAILMQVILHTSYKERQALHDVAAKLERAAGAARARDDDTEESGSRGGRRNSSR
ncbi:MAG TPA: hypothetical protein VNE62_10555 [Actinomycetota bacterium]|nr:hypothetical protein [Actinomycetota bacterium]